MLTMIRPSYTAASKSCTGRPNNMKILMINFRKFMTRYYLHC